jgi:hypothetical protein
MPASEAPAQAAFGALDPNSDPVRPGPPRRRGYGQWVVSRMSDLRAVLSDPATTVDLLTPKAMMHGLRQQDIGADSVLAISRIVGRTHRQPNDAERRSAIAITRRLQAGLADLDLAGAIGAVVGSGPDTIDAQGDLLRPILGAWRASALGIDAELGQRIEDGLVGLIVQMERQGIHALSGLEPLAAATMRDLHRLETGRDDAGIPVLHWISPAFLAIVPLAHTGVSMLAHLAQSPDLQHRLRRRPELRDGYVREVERLLGAFRYATRQIGPGGLDLGPVRLPPRAVVVLDLSAANRDPEIWDRPDDWCLDRPRSATATFGFGPLGCTGAVLSRQFLGRLLDAVLATARVAETADAGAADRLPADWSIIRGDRVRRLRFLPP